MQGNAGAVVERHSHVLKEVVLAGPFKEGCWSPYPWTGVLTLKSAKGMYGV
jgi:hypothetical protein